MLGVFLTLLDKWGHPQPGTFSKPSIPSRRPLSVQLLPWFYHGNSYWRDRANRNRPKVQERTLRHRSNELCRVVWRPHWPFMQKHLVRPQFATGFQKAPFGRRTISIVEKFFWATMHFAPTLFVNPSHWGTHEIDLENVFKLECSSSFFWMFFIIHNIRQSLGRGTKKFSQEMARFKRKGAILWRALNRFGFMSTDCLFGGMIAGCSLWHTDHTTAHDPHPMHNRNTPWRRSWRLRDSSWWILPGFRRDRNRHGGGVVVYTGTRG